MNGFREAGRRVPAFFHWRDFAKKAKLQMKISKTKLFSREVRKKEGKFH
jgi:hypothetical protein